MFNNKGFTLIELLVVVLVIGILAAIAVPQYSLSTAKSRFYRAKETVNELKKASRFYYLQNGVYPTKMSQLDFTHKFKDSCCFTTPDYTCSITNSGNEISCKTHGNQDIMLYLVNVKTNKAICRAYSKDTSDIYNRICQQDTGKSAPDKNCGSFCQYTYPDKI